MFAKNKAKTKRADTLKDQESGKTRNDLESELKRTRIKTRKRKERKEGRKEGTVRI